MKRVLCLLFVCGWAAAAAHATTERALRGFFEAVSAGFAAEVGGRTLHHPRMIGQVYGTRQHAPLWTSGGPLAAQVGDLIAAIERSTGHGLRGENYHLSALTSLVAQDPDGLALELLANDAFLRQARHRSTGAVSPADLDPEWYLLAPEADAVGVLLDTATAAQPLARALDTLWPDSDEYRALVDHRARILALGDTQSVQVPAGPLLKPGQSNERVLRLKERLLGPGDHSPEYDAELKMAVVAFQRSAGLEPDGIVGEATLEVMNASRFSWIDRIDANLERWRWLPAHQPDTIVRVNIAAYSLRVIQSGEDVLSMDVIVGRPYRRTPVFTEPIKYMVFNPYWNVPYRLATQDKLPELKRDAAAMAAQGYEARRADGDRFLPVTEVDWSRVARGNFDYLLRQRPGPLNALGQVKLMLPNPYAVYLHDTPIRALFSKQERGFSSGCVRLARPLELARWLLEHDGRAEDAARIPDIIDSGETVTLYLRQPVPAYLVYFTAFTDPEGHVVFRRDLYQRDAPLIAALRGVSS